MLSQSVLRRISLPCLLHERTPLVHLSPELHCPDESIAVIAPPLRQVHCLVVVQGPISSPRTIVIMTVLFKLLRLHSLCLMIEGKLLI